MDFPRDLSFLRDRAAHLQKVRRFFSERNVLEVDCPSLTTGAPVDLHIDLFQVPDLPHSPRYLHSSPEYCMKRLLVEGSGDIYQLGHVFRFGEVGRRHNPEFTMAEWYRIGFTFQQMMNETVEFIRLFLEGLPVEEISYREAIQKYAGIDYVNASDDDLLTLLKKNQVPLYEGIEKEGRDALLNLIIAELVEPHLGRGKLTLLAYYPASQAALAAVVNQEGVSVAERFEVYVEGIELANGYHELADCREQRSRFLLANEERVRHGKEPLPLDEFFLKALGQGLPDCCGVAVGFDRLMMLRRKETTIAAVLPFDWGSC